MPEIQNSENLNILYSNLIIEELVRLNVTYFCISPGSRSAPLTIATARNSKTETCIIYDERGAAFHAIGYARASKRPAVLICSSGTATANYYPAVIEAYQENIPLIILSADRPAELRNTGANQTIDQVNLFGKYSMFFADLPCPEEREDAAFILNIIDDAFSAATAINAGPVHLNCQFREPLSPKKLPWPESYIANIKLWIITDKPFTSSTKENPTIAKRDISSIVKIVNESPAGLILTGRNEQPDDQKAILKCAEKTGWPIFADITSGLRFNPSPFIIHHFDILLMDENFLNKLKGLPILHFGGQFVSKKLLNFLEQHKGDHIHISDTSKIIDPAKSVTLKVQNSICAFIENLLPNLQQKKRSSLLDEAQNLNNSVQSEVVSFSVEHEGSLNEISVINLITRHIKDDSSLFIASSMPIRDMDKFAQPVGKSITIGANRGASGIDGTIASAVGFAVGSKKPTTLLIGDLAFLHDQSSLVILSEMDIPLTIVLINNQGGGIFSFLPISDHKDVFERNFGTPHNLSFKNLAEQYSMNYFTPKTNNNFCEVYQKCQSDKTSTLIEIKSERKENYELHKNIDARIKLKLV